MSVFISIIIPLYNKERFIENTLHSVFNQTFSDYEVIIVDDCSTDQSLNKVKEVIKSQDKKITLYENKENKGVSFSRNKGLHHAQGDFVLFLDADDQLSEDAILEKLYKIIKTYQLNSVLLRRTYPIPKNTSFIEKIQPYINKVDEDLYKISDKDNFAAYGDFPFGGSGSMIISCDIAKNYRFDESSQRFEDWSYFVPIFLEHNTYYYHYTCVIVIPDENSLSNNPSFKHKVLPQLYEYLDTNHYSKLRKMFFWKLLLGFIDDKKGLSYNLKILWKYKRFIIKNHQWSRFVLKKERSTIFKIIKGVFSKKSVHKKN